MTRGLDRIVGRVKQTNFRVRDQILGRITTWHWVFGRTRGRATRTWVRLNNTR